MVNDTRKQLFRFIFVGLINTVFGYSIYALLLWLGLSYFVALMLSTTLGIMFNFQTIGRIVFKSHDLRLIFRFFGVYLIVFLFNWLLIKLGLIVGMNAYLSGAVAVVPAAAVSFLLNKFFVFNR